MQRTDSPIVGSDVPDPRSLRTQQGVRDLDEFLEFLTRLDAVFGPIERRPEIIMGDHFLL